jgi:hypothetical protein
MTKLSPSVSATIMITHSNSNGIRTYGRSRKSTKVCIQAVAASISALRRSSASIRSQNLSVRS